MIIKTKFDIEDKAFFIQMVQKYIRPKKCNLCDQNGMITIKKNVYKCPECNGAKETPRKKIEYKVMECVVISVYMYYDIKKPAEITYRVREYNFGAEHSLNLLKIFKTKSHASRIARDKGAVQARYVY